MTNNGCVRASFLSTIFSAASFVVICFVSIKKLTGSRHSNELEFHVAVCIRAERFVIASIVERFRSLFTSIFVNALFDFVETEKITARATLDGHS